MQKLIEILISLLMKLGAKKKVREIASQVTLPQIEQITGLDIPDQIVNAVGDVSLGDVISPPEKIMEGVFVSLSEPVQSVEKIATDLQDGDEILSKVSEISPIAGGLKL